MFRQLPSDVVALLAGQHGVATVAQLHAAGLTRRRCALAVERGMLLRPHRGVYVDREAWRAASDETRNAMRLLAVQLVAPDAVGVSTTAAMVWQLPVRRPPHRPDVVRAPHRGRLAGATVRRGVAPYLDADVVRVEGLLVTSLAVTCADVAGSAELADALITVDAALRRGVSSEDLQAAVGRLTHATRRRHAERAIAVADPWSESWLESLSRGRAVEARLPLPLCNVTLVAGGREARVDKLWAEAGVIGEADGKGKYQQGDAAEAHWREKQRHEWLEDLGFEVARWGAREAGGDGSAMTRRLQRAFARRAGFGTGWPRGDLRAELRALPGVQTPARVVAEVERLRALGVPIRLAAADPWRAPERPGSLWTP